MGIFDMSHILYVIACFNHSNKKDLCLIVHYILLYLNNANFQVLFCYFHRNPQNWNDLILNQRATTRIGFILHTNQGNFPTNQAWKKLIGINLVRRSEQILIVRADPHYWKHINTRSKTKLEKSHSLANVVCWRASLHYSQRAGTLMLARESPLILAVYCAMFFLSHKITSRFNLGLAFVSSKFMQPLYKGMSVQCTKDLSPLLAFVLVLFLGVLPLGHCHLLPTSYIVECGEAVWLFFDLTR